MASISIIIPVYNAEEYLEECLDSVLQQDIIDKEIICVDDGSTDASVEIVKGYQKRGANIKLLQQKNQGAAVARNKALDVAQGDYIAFMDADDYYVDATALRKMVTVCEENQVMICGSYRMLVEDEKQRSSGLWENEINNVQEYRQFNYSDYQYDYDYQSYIFKHSLIEQAQLRFPHYRRFQDPPFFAEAMWRAKEFVVVPVYLYGYRIRPRCMKYSSVQTNDMLQGIFHNIKFAKENGLEKLYKRNVERLDGECYYILRDAIFDGDLNAVQRLKEIEDFVQQKLRILNDVRYWLFEKKYQIEKYRFPYDLIPKNAKVAVYGAGVAGKELVGKIGTMNYCTLVVWVDKQYNVLRENGLEVESPECLVQYDFDYILVAVEREEVFEEIKAYIIEIPGNTDKQIIGPVKRI